MNNDSENDSNKEDELENGSNKASDNESDVDKNAKASQSADSPKEQSEEGQSEKEGDTTDDNSGIAEETGDNGDKPDVVESKAADADAKHDHLYKCLGEVMRERRKSLQLSQEQLAAGSGIDRAFLSNLERGLRKPSFGTVARIAHGLKIKYSRLVAKCEKCQEERAKSA